MLKKVRISRQSSSRCASETGTVGLAALALASFPHSLCSTKLRNVTASLRRLTANRRPAGITWNQVGVRDLMQTPKRAGTVIFVSTTSPEATVAQNIEAYGLEMQWAPSIRAAVDLLNSTREKTVIVTQLALPDGNWRDLVECQVS
jgi:hypothetical protein